MLLNKISKKKTELTTVLFFEFDLLILHEHLFIATVIF